MQVYEVTVCRSPSYSLAFALERLNLELTLSCDVELIKPAVREAECIRVIVREPSPGLFVVLLHLWHVFGFPVQEVKEIAL